jgi:hypothetical protein
MRFAVILLAATLLAAGCSQDGRPELAPVVGTVTLDGRPLHRAAVVFRPAEGKFSRGVTNEQGHYELTYLRDTMGAIVGKHKAVITTADGEAVRREILPARYHRRTELTAEVKRGDNTFDFALQSR